MNDKIEKLYMGIIDLLDVSDFSKEILKKNIKQAYLDGVHDGLEKAKNIYSEVHK